MGWYLDIKNVMTEFRTLSSKSKMPQTAVIANLDTYIFLLIFV
jgi:hypothetical protein